MRHQIWQTHPTLTNRVTQSATRYLQSVYKNIGWCQEGKTATKETATTNH